LIGLKHFNKEIIIENPGTEEDGIKVTDEGDGFILKNVTVQNFKYSGVFLIRVDKFVLDHVLSINNNEFGLFPVLCNDGVIKFCTATGSSDTGIYIGQSTNITVEFNLAFANVSGFEIENCTNVTATCNESYDNAAGFAVILLPQLTVKTASNILITHNNIHNNNRGNIPSGGGLEDFIPSGSGILLVGADNVTIQKNVVRNNNFVGIATVSTLVLGQMANIRSEAFDIEPNPDGVKIVQNFVSQNGSAAPPGLPLPAADLLWDGSGINNCWKNNIRISSFPASLPVCMLLKK
jgi:parallel beta-helix repeat protein